MRKEFKKTVMDLAGQDDLIDGGKDTDQAASQQIFGILQRVSRDVVLDPLNRGADRYALVIPEIEGDRAILGLGIGESVHITRIGAGDEHVDEFTILVGARTQLLIARISLSDHALYRRQDIGQGNASADFRLGLHVLLEALHPL